MSKKTYIIKLSSPEVMTSLKVLNQNSVVVEEEKSVREIEIQMLTDLFTKSGIDNKNGREVLAAWDSVGQLENLSDHDDFEADDKDIELLQKTFEELAGKRTSIWAKATKVINQFINPTEVQQEEESV